MDHTATVQAWFSSTEEEDVYNLLLLLDALAYFINNTNQAHIRLYEDIFALRIQLLTLCYNADCSILRTSNKVSTRLTCVFCEFLERYFTNSAGCPVTKSQLDLPGKDNCIELRSGDCLQLRTIRKVRTYPTKTATSPWGKTEDMRELED